MLKFRVPLLLAVLLAVSGALYLLFSAPDYGDINADGLKLGKLAYQQGDFGDAVKWFRLAAKKGDKQAQYLFAMLYRNGEGVSHDDEQAVLWLKLAAKQDHPEAQYQLANMLEYGRGTGAADLKAAIGWYTKAAELGYNVAQLRMAVMLTEGRGIAKNDARGLAWAIKAASSNSISATSYLQHLLNRISVKAAAGDAAAQFVLARMYQQGEGMNMNPKKAEQWLKQSAVSGNAKAQYHLAELLIHRSKSAQKTSMALQQAAGWYLKAAEQGDIQAAAKIGVLYALGQGVASDRAQAVVWLKKAAASGLATAQRNLAILSTEAKNMDSALAWLHKAAEQGETVAQNNLAVMYALGRGVKANVAKAVIWLKASAQAGDSMAQYNFGLMSLRGVGIIQNEDVAVKWLRKAQDGGQDDVAGDVSRMKAKLLLGILYDLGYGVVPSETDAEFWYQQASSLGSADASYNLATLYYRHLKFKKAFDLFMQAAKSGDAEAQNIIASMYQKGQGGGVNLKQAVYWFHQAAKYGYAPAQFNLATLYRKGEAMEQQDEQAAHWYRQAAKQGFGPAQNALAYMYALGRGVALDRMQSQIWFARAAEQGLNIAGQNLSLLKQNKSAFTLISRAVDVQLRANVLYEKPLDLAHRLLVYRTPLLRSFE